MEEQLVKYFSGNLTSEEMKEIDDWRSESDINAFEFLEYHHAWKLSEPRNVDAKTALETVMGRIEANEGRFETVGNQGWGSMLKYAAIAILGVGLAFFASQFYSTAPAQLVIESADNLEIVSLPDGSVVTLSQHSELIFNKTFSSNTRDVTLKGKAFFDIKRDESKPFIVHTDQSRIEVLGTSFLVNTAGMNAGTEVVVKTGRVAVSKKESKKSDVIELVAGEVGRLEAGSRVFQKSAVADFNYLAWKTKLIEFQKDNLRNVLETLSDVYHVEVKVSDAKIYNCQMSAKFDNQPIDAILEILSRTFNLELTKTGKKSYTLTGEGCISVP